jgi:amino acid adenylation domain-containing protein
VTAEDGFWRTAFDGAVLAVPFAHPASGARGREGWRTVEDAVAPASAARLLAALPPLGATPFDAGLAATAAVLEHYAHRPDVVVLAAPPGEGAAHAPVRLEIAGDPAFAALVAAVRAAAARTAAQGATPLDEALRRAGLTADASGAGGCAVAFECAAADRPTDAKATGAGCVVRLVAEPGSLRVRVTYRRTRMDRVAAERLAGRIAAALAAFGDDRSRPLSRLDLVAPDERNVLLTASRGPNGPPRPWPAVPDAVEAAARRDPRAPAVVEEDRVVSYGELLAAADELAARLAARGVGAGDVVPVISRRSAATVASWLGVLRSGAAYAPIDAEQPAARRAAMVEDAGARVVVCDPSADRDLGARAEAIPSADVAATAARSFRAAPRGDLAYVIFTSGSTGRPKGVEIGHEALAHLIACRRRTLSPVPSDRATLVSGLGFDVAAAETWTALCAGASLHLPPADVRLDPERLRDWLVGREITLAFAPTIIAESLVRMPWPRSAALRVLETAGEALHRRPLPGLPFEFVNLYGPTEFTVYATRAVVAPEGGGLPPIGLPLEDTAGFVTDHRGRLCGEGVVGELQLAGPQLARGYRGRPDATAAAFAELSLEPGRRERTYRTGDLVRRAPGGVLEFIGRRDGQIKLRGVRIELGEIVACLEAHPAVDCAVVVVEDASDPAARLAAYVVLHEPANGVRAADLLEHASQNLPRSMVPARIAAVPAIPLTPNGKADVAALRAAAPAPVEAFAAESLTPIETRVLSLWREMLALPALGPDDDFFAAGGHSFLAVRTLAALERATGVRLPARVFFEAPTARGFAAYVAAARNASEPEHPSVVRIRDGFHGAPLFCLPGAGGHAFQYRALAARLHTPRAVFALQVHDLDVPSSTFESVEATADAFVQRIRRVRPAGPYALTGYSYGGVVAVEIARRLAASGEPVPFVGLVDTYPPGATSPSPRLRRMARHLDNIASMGSFRDALTYVRQKMRRRGGRVSFALRERLGGAPPPSTDLERRIEETSIRCVRAYEAYAAKPFAGRLTAFRAAKLIDWEDVEDPTSTCGWGPLCDSVEVVDIDCEHTQLFKEPYLSELARRVDESLARLGDEG